MYRKQTKVLSPDVLLVSRVIPPPTFPTFGVNDAMKVPLFLKNELCDSQVIKVLISKSIIDGQRWQFSLQEGS